MRATPSTMSARILIVALLAIFVAPIAGQCWGMDPNEVKKTIQTAYNNYYYEILPNPRACFYDIRNISRKSTARMAQAFLETSTTMIKDQSVQFIANVSRNSLGILNDTCKRQFNQRIPIIPPTSPCTTLTTASDTQGKKFPNLTPTRRPNPTPNLTALG